MCRRMLTETWSKPPQSNSCPWAIYFPSWSWISEGKGARLLVTKSRRSQEKRPGTSWNGAVHFFALGPRVESMTPRLVTSERV